MKQAIERFKQYIKSRYPNSTTARHYEHDLQQFNQLIGKSSRAITREDVDRFVKDQLDRGLAATTVNRRLASVHEFFEYLAEENPEEEWPNPVNGKRHRIKEGKPLPRDISDSDIERLFEQVTHPRDKAMFRLMLDVGLRVKEVSKLRVGDLTTTSDGSLKRLLVRGKGDKERFVWLVPETLEVVEAWLEQRPAVEDEAMFVTRRKKGFSVRGIEERLAHYSRKAGVSASPHQLRHTYGRRMAEAGMPVTSLAALMGHAQVTTTQIYIAGAGVGIQADYQSAIERLKAGGLETPLVQENGREGSAGETETLNVWQLAGVEPRQSPSSTVKEEMDLSRFWKGLPEWLTVRLQEYIAYRQRRWKPSQVRHNTRTHLQSLCYTWRRLLNEEEVGSIGDLERVHVQRYVDARLDSEISAGTVNVELTNLWAFLHYLEDRGEEVRHSVFRVKRPKRGDHVPRFLSESDFRQLESTVLKATETGRRDDLLNRAWFYLFSETGMRISEVRDLGLGDIDLGTKRLIVRQGKGKRDRTIPISPTLETALKAYLPARGEAQSDHLLIYRQKVISVKLIEGRLHRYGQKAQVKVSPHRLRHTLATRLLNAGMPITSLQRLLGHDKLDTTLIYARVHNETVRRDYERAYACLTPASSLANELFNAPTRIAEPHSIALEVNCV
jgi:integrase/recombinase XerD